MKKKQAGIYALSALTSALLLSGCLGGGGKTDGGSAAAPIDIGGVGAAGHLKNAKISIYCGKTESAAKLIGSGLTSAVAGKEGQFNVTLTSTTCSDPITTVVTPNDVAPFTTMLNKLGGAEVSIPAGSGFKLRQYRASLPKSNVSDTYITPFSDMVASVADKLNSAPDAATVAQAGVLTAKALGVPQELLNTNPVRSTELATASNAEKKLYKLGAAVEQIAAGNGNTVIDPALLKTAIENLQTQIAAAIIATTNATNATDTSTSGIAKILADADAQLPPAVTNGTGTAALIGMPDTTATPKVATTLASTIADAKAFLSALKTDYLVLWNPVGNTGFLNSKAAEMLTDSKSLKAVSGDLGTYLRVMDVGYFKNANPARLGSGSFFEAFATKTGVGITSGQDAEGYFRQATLQSLGVTGETGACKVYTTDSTNQIAVTPKKVKCHWNDPSSHKLVTGGYEINDIVVVMQADTAANTMKWETSRRTKTFLSTDPYYPNSPGSVFYFDKATSTSPFTLTGTATSTKNAAGDITRLVLAGDVIPFVNPVTPINTTGVTKSTLNLTANAAFTETTVNSIVTGGTGSMDITGSVVSGAATLSILTGSQYTDTWTNGTSGTTAATATAETTNSTFKLVLRGDTAKFRYDGTFEGKGKGSWKWGNDNSQDNSTDGSGSFVGTVSSLSNAVATQFFEGKLGSTWAWTETTPAHNYYTPASSTSVTSFAEASMSGTVTNGSKVYKITASSKDATDKSHDVVVSYTNPANKTVTFKTKDTSDVVTTTNGSSVTGATAGDDTVIITDGTTTFTYSKTLKPNASKKTYNGVGEIKAGTTALGTLLKNKASFEDGSYMLII
jgi:hypothetical protein